MTSRSLKVSHMLTPTIYFDNSSWNALAEGDKCKIRRGLLSTNIVTCYSIENLLEMLSTTNQEKLAQFQKTMDELNCRLLTRENGEALGKTYKASYSELNTQQRWERFKEAKLMSPIGTFGLTDLLQKMIGGIPSKSNEDIMTEALENMKTMLDDAIKDLDDDNDKILMQILKENLLQKAKEASTALVEQLANSEEFKLPELDHVHIVNFTGPGVVERIFKEAENPKYTGVIDLIDGFCSHIPRRREEGRKCNATYDMIVNLAQLLFLLRYKREAKNTRDGERARVDFQGSMTDFYHIANSSVCSIFHTCDKAQAHMAAAVFDHFDIKTLVTLHQRDNDSPTTLYKPRSLSGMLSN